MENSYPQVDYDLVAETYNQRFGDHTPDPTGEALLSLIESCHAQNILEIGCGTGHWLSILRNPGLTLYGADLSYGMLAQAQLSEGPFHLVQTPAEKLPFAHNHFDLIFCVNAVHHFNDLREFIQEAYCALQPGGRIGILGHDPHRNNDQWYVYEYFAHVYQNDLTRFTPWVQLIDWMGTAGFLNIRLAPVGRIVANKIGREVLGDPYLKKNATSQLILTSDADYYAGIMKIQAALQEAEDQGHVLVFPIDLTLEMIIGQKRTKQAN
jgi:ubiquinone/menaquinone biosynthesis C-methylase UbiE